MNILELEFLNALKRNVSSELFTSKYSDQLVITIKSSSSEVGDLIVSVDEEEISVSIGIYFHSHFEVYAEDAVAEGDRVCAAANKAVKFVRDVLDERVRFRGQFSKGRCLSFSSWYPEKSEGIRQLSGADFVQDYVWSGRVR